MTPDPIYFPSAAALRRWFKTNHRSAAELWVGFHKKDSGTPGVTYREAVEEAICVGWIDGIVKKVDATRFMQRYTPRRTNRWSAVNIARAETLIAEGRMQPAGRKAFESRDAATSGYSVGQRARMAFSRESETRFRKHAKAWRFWQTLPPGYRRNHIWHVESAKRPETRARRLDGLIAACEAGIKLDPMRPLSEQLGSE